MKEETKVYVLEVDTCGYDGVSLISNVFVTLELAKEYIEKHYKHLYSGHFERKDKYTIYGYDGNVYEREDGVIMQKNRDDENDLDDTYDYEAESVCLTVKEFDVVGEVKWPDKSFMRSTKM